MDLFDYGTYFCLIPSQVQTCCQIPQGQVPQKSCWKTSHHLWLEYYNQCLSNYCTQLHWNSSRWKTNQQMMWCQPKWLDFDWSRGIGLHFSNSNDNICPYVFICDIITFVMAFHMYIWMHYIMSSMYSFI